MSIRRATTWALSGLKAGGRQCPRKHYAASQPRQTRTISTRTFALLDCHGLPRIRSHTLGIWSKSRPTSALPQGRREFSVTFVVAHGDITPPKPGEELHVTFIDKEGDEHSFEVSAGDNLLDIAQANDLEMEGACGGSCACSTCHVIVEDEAFYDKMNEPDDDENDMLDLAFGLTETSRLGCQVVMSKDLDGLRVKLPSMTRNLQASDFSKKNERSD